MATFQKKTSDLLKEQKASYPKMVKSALKGKTGLTRAQVHKTIKGVAKDYRDRYGATPRKRYLNVVKQVASTMPKTTKTAKPQATSKPKATSTVTPKKEMPEFLRKQQEAAERRIKARTKRILQRTEAAFANHKAEQAKKTTEPKPQLKRKEELGEAELKAKYGTLNEAFIKKFAADLGLTTATIKAMYKVAADYRKEGNLRPIMCGLYCDPEGYLVATDAHMLISIKCKIPAKYKGKTCMKSGMQLENDYPNRYPNWKAVMPLANGKPNKDYTHTDLFTAYPEIKGKKFIDHKEREYTIIKTADGKDIGLTIEPLKKADKVFKTLKEKEIKIWTKSPSASVLFLGHNVAAIQMPFLFND